MNAARPGWTPTHATFTEAERARAIEIRAWADRPENVHLQPNRLDSLRHGAVFAGIRTAYSVSVLHGLRYRTITFSCLRPGFEPCPTCATDISIGLFDFDPDKRVIHLVDPFAPFVKGVAQLLEAEGPS